ncbi:hypothetical protein [Spirosoma sp.]|uniref:hypothetical protein n=1 Tax=Spirosoma sp. TaxID=1899569 RepID=UPI003B3AB96D
MFRSLSYFLLLGCIPAVLVAQSAQFPNNTTIESCQSIQSGDWNNPAIWSCNHVPTPNDQVVLNIGHRITISSPDAQAQKLIYQGGTLQLSESGRVFIGASVVSPVIYRIRAGQQYSDQNPLVFTHKTTLTFSATFNESAIYTTRLPENQSDINKLYGFSDCNTHHSLASARFGWNWRDNALRIYAYCYVNGQRIAQELGIAQLNVANDYQIILSESAYTFIFLGKQTVIARGCTTVESTQRYLLYPYFGGDETAPHDITIAITEK